MAKPFTVQDAVFLPNTAEMARPVAELYMDDHLPPGIDDYHFEGYVCDASFQVVATYRFEGRTEDEAGRKYVCVVRASAAEMVEDPRRSAKGLLHAAARSIADLLEKDKKDAA